MLQLALHKKSMNQYLLIFRMDILTPEKQPTPAMMKDYMTHWMAWIDSISATGQLAGGNHLQVVGKVLRPGNAEADGVYAANNESVAGYIIVTANNLDGATEIARKCPILRGEGTSVEIRPVAAM